MAANAPPTRGPFDEFIEASSTKYGVPPAVIRANILTESSGDPKATRDEGFDKSYGLMQVLTGTARQMGWQGSNPDELFEPSTNIDLGTKYLRDRWDNVVTKEYPGGWQDAKSLRALAAAYNAGKPFEDEAGNFTNSKGKPITDHVDRWSANYDQFSDRAVPMATARYLSTADEILEWGHERASAVQARQTEIAGKGGDTTYARLMQSAQSADQNDLDSLDESEKAMSVAWNDFGNNPAAYLQEVKRLAERTPRPRVQALLRAELDTAARSATAFTGLHDMAMTLFGPDVLEGLNESREELRAAGEVDALVMLDTLTDYRTFHRAYVETEKDLRGQPRDPANSPGPSAAAVDAMLSKSEAGHALRRLISSPDAIARLQYLSGKVDPTAERAAAITQIEPEVLDYAASARIYEDIMDSREAIAEHGQRVLGVPYRDTMERLDEWGTATRTALEGARGSLPIPVSTPKEYRPVGKGRWGDELARGVAEALSQGREGWAERVAPLARRPEYIAGFIPSNATAALMTTGSLLADAPAVVGSFMISGPALASLRSARGLFRVMRAGQAIGAAEATGAVAIGQTARSVFAQGAMAGLVYSGLNQRFAANDMKGRAKEIPINVVAFGGLDVLFYGAGNVVRAAGRGGKRILAAPGPIAKKVTRAFRDRITSMVPERPLTGPAGPAEAAKAGPVSRKLETQGGRPAAVQPFTGQFQPLRERRDNLLSNTLQTWHRGMRDKVMSRPQIEEIIDEGLLRGFDDQAIYSAFLDAYHEAGPRGGLVAPQGGRAFEPGQLAFEERGRQLQDRQGRGRDQSPGVPDDGLGITDRIAQERAAVGSAEVAGTEAQRLRGNLEREGRAADARTAELASLEAQGARATPAELTGTVPEAVTGRRARKAQEKALRVAGPQAAERLAEGVTKLQRSEEAALKKGRAAKKRLAEDEGTLARGEKVVRSTRKRYERATEAGFKGEVQEFAGLPGEVQKELAGGPRKGNAEIAAVGEAIQAIDRAIKEIFPDVAGIRRKLRAASSQQRMALLKRQLGTRGSGNRAGSIKGGSYILDGDGLKLTIGDRTYTLDNRKLIRWIGENPPKIAQVGKSPPSPETRGAAKPATAPRGEAKPAPEAPPAAVEEPAFTPEQVAQRAHDYVFDKARGKPRATVEGLIKRHEVLLGETQAAGQKNAGEFQEQILGLLREELDQRVGSELGHVASAARQNEALIAEVDKEYKNLLPGGEAIIRTTAGKKLVGFVDDYAAALNDDERQFFKEAITRWTAIDEAMARRVKAREAKPATRKQKKAAKKPPGAEPPTAKLAPASKYPDEGAWEAAYEPAENAIYVNEEFARARPDRLAEALEHELVEKGGLTHEVAVAVERATLERLREVSPEARALEAELKAKIERVEPTEVVPPEKLAEIRDPIVAADQANKIAEKAVPAERTNVTTQLVNVDDLKARPSDFQGREGELVPIEGMDAVDAKLATMLDDAGVDRRGLDLRNVYDKLAGWDQDLYLMSGEIVVWKNPKGELVVVSGHHRHAALAIGAGPLKVPVKVFEGTFEEAQHFARVSNRGSRPEGLHADIRALKAESLGTSSEKELRAMFHGRLGKLRDMSNLDENGPFLRMLTADAGGQPAHLERYARWVGEWRKDVPWLTNTHEREIFDWLYGLDPQALKLDKEQFAAELRRVTGDLFKNPNEPLGLRKLVEIDALERKPGMGDIATRIREIRASIEDQKRLMKAKDTSAAAAKELDENIKALRVEEADVLAKAEGMEENQRTLFSHGEAEGPAELAALRKIHKEVQGRRGLETGDTDIDAMQNLARQMEGDLRRAFEHEASTEQPNLHRSKEYGEILRTAAGPREIFNAMIWHRAHGGAPSARAITKDEFIAAAKDLAGGDLAWHELKVLTSTADAVGLKGSDIVRIFEAVAPLNEAPSYHEILRAQEVVQTIWRSKGDLSPAKIDAAIEKITGRDLSLAELNVAGEAVPAPLKKLPFRKGEYYEQTKASKARAYGKSAAQKEELGVKSGDDAIREDFQATVDLWEAIGAKTPVDELPDMPMLAAEVLDMDAHGGKDTWGALGKALDKALNPTPEAREWSSTAPYRKVLQSTHPWSLDATEHSGLRIMDTIRDMQDATVTRGRFLHTTSLQLDRILGNTPSEYIHGRLVPNSLRKPKGMSAEEFHTRQSVQNLPKEHGLRNFITKLMEVNEGREVERAALLEDIAHYMKVNKLDHDVETIGKMARELSKLLDEAREIVDASGTPTPRRKNYVPTVYHDELRPGYHRLDDAIIGGRIDGFSHQLPRASSHAPRTEREELVHDPFVLANVYLARSANTIAYARVLPKAKMQELFLRHAFGAESNAVRGWRKTVNGMLGKPTNTDVVVDITMNKVGDALRMARYGGHSLADVFPMFRDSESFKAFYRATNKLVYSILGKPSSIVKNSTQPVMMPTPGGSMLRNETLKAWGETNIINGGIFSQPDIKRLMQGKLPQQRSYGFGVDHAGNVKMRPNHPESALERMLADSGIAVEYLPELIEHRTAMMKHGGAIRTIDEWAEFALTGYRLQDLINRATDFKGFTRTFDKRAIELRAGKIKANEFYDEIGLEFFHDVEVRRFLKMTGKENMTERGWTEARDFLARQYVSHRQFSYSRGMGPSMMQGYLGGLFRFGSWGFHYMNFLRRMMIGQSTRIRAGVPSGAGEGTQRVRIKPFGVVPEEWTKLLPKLHRLNSGKAVNLTGHREDLMAGMQAMHFLGAGALVAGVAAYGVGAWRPQSWVMFGPAPDLDLFSSDNWIVPETMFNVIEAQIMLPALAAGAVTGITTKEQLLAQLNKSYESLVLQTGPATAASRAVLAITRYVQQTPLEVPGGRAEPITLTELLRGIMLNSDAVTYRKRTARRVRGRIRGQEKADVTGDTWFNDLLIDPAENALNAVDAQFSNIDVEGIRRLERKQARTQAKKERTSGRKARRRSIGNTILETVTQRPIGG